MIDDVNATLETFQRELIQINPDEVEKWIQMHNAPKRRVNEMLKLLESDLSFKQISNVNVHVKQESLLKEDQIF